MDYLDQLEGVRTEIAAAQHQGRTDDAAQQLQRGFALIAEVFQVDDGYQVSVSDLGDYALEYALLAACGEWTGTVPPRTT